MAGIFTHAWIANLVLQKLSKRSFISKFENIDDYFFGSIAPDIRYLNGSERDVTHKPKGESSIFEALKISSLSLPFIAGFETHLVVDDTWSNENRSLDKSIYEYYGVNVNDPIQKFSLYLVVDDYFQGESGWVFKFATAGNILRANDTKILEELGINKNDIFRYKTAVAVYLREPGIDTFIPFNVLPDEKLLKEIVDKIKPLSAFLKDFKKASIENCLESLEKYL